MAWRDKLRALGFSTLDMGVMASEEPGCWDFVNSVKDPQRSAAADEYTLFKQRQKMPNQKI